MTTYIEVKRGRLAWRFRLPENQWYVSSAQDIADGYDSLALIKRPSTCKMPSWWTPEQQVAWRCPACGVHESGKAWIPETGGGVGHEQYRITASLETGEEVPA